MAVFRVCLGLSLVSLRWRSGHVDARAGGICSRFNVVVSDRRDSLSHFRVGRDHTSKAPRSHYFASRDLAGNSPSLYSARAGAIAPGPGFRLSFVRADWPKRPLDTRFGALDPVPIPLIVIAAFVLVAFVGWKVGLHRP